MFTIPLLSFVKPALAGVSIFGAPAEAPPPPPPAPVVIVVDAPAEQATTQATPSYEGGPCPDCTTAADAVTIQLPGGAVTTDHPVALRPDVDLRILQCTGPDGHSGTVPAASLIDPDADIAAGICTVVA
jgi:hypothetical protein